MVSESCLEVVFCHSDVRFSSVIVVVFNGCLVDEDRVCDRLTAVA